MYILEINRTSPFVAICRGAQSTDKVENEEKSILITVVRTDQWKPIGCECCIPVDY